MSANNPRSNKIASSGPVENEIGNLSSIAQAQVQSAPPRKKARTAKNNRSKNNKNNSLPGLLVLPLELFAEVMGGLKPIDVLNLSRTCKSLRNVLMRRSSEYIWKRATENLPYHFPPPPPWMDMPQYISVIYTQNCSACGGKAAQPARKWIPKFQPVLLVRLCHHDKRFYSLIRAVDIPELLRSFIVTSLVQIHDGQNVNMRSGQYGLRAEVQRLEKELKANKNKFTEDKEAYKAWRLANEQAITRYSQLTRTQEDYWHLLGDIEGDQDMQKREVKDQFRREVEKRLIELGWEHDMDFVRGREWKSLVSQPRNLTDRIWKNLYPKFGVPLRKARSDRLAALPLLQQENLNKLLGEKYRDLGARIMVRHRHAAASKSAHARLTPPASEVVNWPSIKRMLEPCPSDKDIKKCVSENWEIIRPLAETWQHGVESQLARRLEDDVSFTRVPGSGAGIVVSGISLSEDLEVLLRADSVFRFTDNTARYFPDDFMEPWEPPSLYRAHKLNVASPSIVKGAQSFTMARNQAKALLQCLGQPDASHISMVSYGKRFVCGICVHWAHTCTKIYDWKELLNHYASAVNPEPDNTVDFAQLDLGDATRAMHLPGTGAKFDQLRVYTLSLDDARKYEQDTATLLTEQPWLSYNQKHACLHCIDSCGLDLPSVVAHVQYMHYVMEPEAHRDYENYDVYIRQSMGVTYEYEN
ncbi:Tiggrin [Rhizoctonia solani]|uniref:Tiggrin n=1 Tax=Rhizoctonia solani TaxID=456999 RepID=A0A0K6FYQ0_9AGAM|nr:Tiggrin [Rhizoctonia solani]